MDAGPEWRLEQVPISGGRGIPAERAQVGRENSRIIGSDLGDGSPAFIAQDRAVELRVPQQLDRLALGVIVDAGQAKGGQAVADAALVLDQPAPGADAHEITALRPRHGTSFPPHPIRPQNSRTPAAKSI